MSLTEAISKAADAAKAVVAGITPDQLELPTPCTDWDVRALGNHLTGFLPYSANAARKGPALEGEAPDFTAEGWSDTFSGLAADLVAAWSEDGVMEGETAFGPGMLPAEYAAGITLMELTVHGWDLAKATGQELVLDPATAELAAQVTAQAAAGGKDTGLFGPPVEAAEHFDEFQKSLAASGRTPT
ncbi:MAG: TIGR03086 family metal-binding protein [Acidimicrobiia bacterium]|nr:TIGR03086 family metal-binding protein [Acidimicrobiia bacterium]MDH5420468.1 TIGR03086 family metal-binding protein [Acidimicrobiia bacterium]MDH5503809.1 TIGR03086 family metal-binding protein [Acidimicrobiia bacterium]